MPSCPHTKQCAFAAHVSQQVVAIAVVFKQSVTNVIEIKWNKKMMNYSTHHFLVINSFGHCCFLRCNSFFINASSRPVCPLTEVFSCARRIR